MSSRRLGRGSSLSPKKGNADGALAGNGNDGGGDDDAGGGGGLGTSVMNYLSFNDNPSDETGVAGGGSKGAGDDADEAGRNIYPGNGGGNADPLSTVTSVEACDHRGFSTSIFDLFADADSERVDCCSLACCGVLQSDRDRYLLQGVTPPGPWKRCTVHFLFPLALFLMAGLCATHIADTRINQFASTLLVLALFVYLFVQYSKGRSKRIGIRKDLLYLKYQIQQQNHPEGARLLNLLDSHGRHPGGNESDDEFFGGGDDGLDDVDMAPYYLGQARRDFRCAHPCCLIGFYADDRRGPAGTAVTKKKKDRRGNSAAAGSSLLGSDGDDGNANDYELSPNICRCLYASVCSTGPCTGGGCCSCCRNGGVPVRSPALCCGMHVQTCGVCAVAQEAREVENVLLPPSYRRIDYVTMQAVTDYYPAIYRARHGIQLEEEGQQQQGARRGSGAAAAVIQLLPGGGQTVLQQPQQAPEPTSAPSRCMEGFLSRHLPPLSRLSLKLVQASLVTAGALLMWSIFGPLYWNLVVRTRNRSHMFSVFDFLVYLATVLQAVVVLALISWFISYRQGGSAGSTERKSKSDLSTDAMIKYFFSGFCLATSLAVFWELLCSLVVRVFVTLVLAIFGVNARQDPEDASSLSSGGAVHEYGDSSYYDEEDVSGNNLRYLRSFLAPSLFSWSSAGFSSSKDFMEAFGNDHPVIYTFYILFSAFCLAALIEELCKYFGYRMVEHPDFFSKSDLVEASRIVMGENNDDESVDEEVVQQLSRRGRGSNNNASPRSSSRITPPDYSKQRQSMQDQGAAITLAMISVAMGFACCENLVYVFLYSSSSLKSELTVLISRSLFPVHPIAAALQSIGVCNRELEGMRRTTLGRIIFPAVMFHGAYDFFILWISFLARRHGIYAGGDGDSAFDAESVVAMLVTFAVSVLLICVALLHLYRESNKQRTRLENMDRQTSVDRSRLT